MSEVTYTVLGGGVFTATYPTRNAWLEQAASEPTAPSGEFIERRTRRRVSALTKALADAYAEAVEDAALDAATAPAVFGSALGEAATMIGLLDQMWRQGEGLSPMKFAMSVHNAAAGAVSISGKNTGFTTSLGADHDTPAMALLEAQGIVDTTGEPVVVVVGDDAVPEDIVPPDAAWELVAVALVVGPADAPNAIARVGRPVIDLDTHADRPIAPTLARNPCVGMLDLIAEIGAGARGPVRLDRGRGRGWCVDVAGA